MELARRGYGDFYGELNQKYPEIARKLKGEDASTALKDYLKFLAQIPGAMEAAGASEADAIQNQKRWTALGFGSDDVNKLVEQGPGKLAAALADAAKNTPVTTAGMIAGAEALSKAAHDLDDAIEKVQTDAGPFVFKQLTQATDDFRAVFDAVSAARDKYKDHPEKVETDAKEQAESGWQHFKKHWSDVGEGKTPLLPNPLDSKSWHLPQPDPKAGLFDVTKEPEGPAPSGIFLPDILKNFRDSVGGIPGDEYGTGAAEPRTSTPDTSALDKLRGAMEHRDGPAPIVMPPALLDHPALDKLRGAMQGGGQAPIVLPSSLLHRSSYIEGDDEDGGERSSAGGMSPNLVMLFRETIASGVKAGMIAAAREMQGEQTADSVGGGGGGVIKASYGAGGVGGAGNGVYGSGAGGMRAPALQPHQAHGEDPYTGTGGTAENAGPGFTSGMRARNLGNIGYFGQHEAGLVGPSNSRDVDHSIAMYATQEDGIRAAARLALRKYQGGMRDTASLIAGPKGWTPGPLGPGASVNIAKAMGLSNRDDLHLDQPEMMHKFLRGLATQEHGKAGSYYSDKMIGEALAGRGATTATGPDAGVTGKTAGVNPVLTDMVKRASEILGVPLSVYSGLRSPEHNAAVHGAEHSLHMRGLATDLTTPGHPKSDRAFWERANGAMAEAAQEFHQPYRWGGNFPGRFHDDNDHFDLTANGPTPEALAKHMDVLEGKQHQLEAHQTKTLSTAHRLLQWAAKGAKADDPPDTPSETRDMRDMRFAPPGFQRPEEPPRKSLLDEANKSGIGGAVKVEHSGGATVEIRGLPDHKGVRTKTSGMIEAVNIRRGPKAQKRW